ncbi:hypothetical protein LDENG_00054670 [Lucifuga dentata]|nr:hypothetical protein LDENG_00054670 [Lucifuga dentata]
MAKEDVISYSDLKALLANSQSLILIDVRTKEEVERGCIPKSINIPGHLEHQTCNIDTVEAALGLDPAEFQAKYGVTKPPMDAPELVFHCQIGKRGAMATEKARKLGYLNARNYAGAYQEWSEKEGRK